VLASKENALPGGTLSKFTYSVNAIGQRTALATTGSAFGNTDRGWNWAYDAYGQVTAATHADDTDLNRSYDYDAIGNRLESGAGVSPAAITSYTPNALNQYSAIEDPQSTILNPIHDSDGNMTSGPLPAAPASASSLVWDGENRLISATVDSTTVNYLYDAQSRLISHTVGTTSTLYIYDGWNRIAEYEKDGTGHELKRSYLWGMDLSGSMQGAGGVGGLLSMTVHDTTSATFYPTYDGNGNVSEYINQNGAKVAHFEYDPFGNLTVDSESNAAAFPYRFSTKPQDQTTGLYYYGYRYYDPVTGRWPSRDPIGEMGGLNLYGFVFNNSLYWYDYLGGKPGSFNRPRNRGNNQPNSNDPIVAVIGNITGALSGDLFHAANPIPEYGKNQCEFLITVSGIRMKNDGVDTQERYFNLIRALPNQSHIQNPVFVNNPSNGPGGALDYIQIMANELHLMTIVDLDMVRQIEAAAKSAKDNGCCCWSIQVFAHSQGTMVFRRALDLIDADTRKHIHFIGLGGQSILHSDMGMASVLNIAHQNDIVPKLPPGNWRYFREEIDTDNINPDKGKVDPHSWEHTYIPYLRDNPDKIKKGKVCN